MAPLDSSSQQEYSQLSILVFIIPVVAMYRGKGLLFGCDFLVATKDINLFNIHIIYYQY